MVTGDGVTKTMFVTVFVCLVCSIVVSTAAVTLRPLQAQNKLLGKHRSVLEVVDLMEPGGNVHELFERYVETRIVNLDSGEFADDIDPRSYDARKAANDPSRSLELSPQQDIASIERRANYATVYLVRLQGELRYVVLPINGYGLWSTLYGFIALQADMNTVYGINFYEHGETPGLGGEVENPRWQALWRGKKIYAPDHDEHPALSVIKGTVNPSASDADYVVDGLAGATLTARGVGNMVQFWFGSLGYQPFLDNLKRGGKA